MIQKLKKLIRNNNSENNEVIEKEIESSIKTVTEKEARICNCCGEKEVIVEMSEMFKVTEDGEKSALFSRPQVTFYDGGVYDNVVICNDCFSSCETEEQKQYVWIYGKTNSMKEIISQKEELAMKNNNEINEIKFKAEERIKELTEENNLVKSEINRLRNTMEMYAQEQEKLESKL